MGGLLRMATLGVGTGSEQQQEDQLLLDAAERCRGVSSQRASYCRSRAHVQIRSTPSGILLHSSYLLPCFLPSLASLHTPSDSSYPPPPPLPEIPSWTAQHRSSSLTS